MILTDSRDGSKYWVHFRHIREQIPACLVRHHKLEGDSAEWIKAGKPLVYCWTSECAIHKGDCKTAERPCQTPNMLVGDAKCSYLDHFRRATGRKIAFTRALHTLPVDLRAELWADYLSRPGNKD